MLDQVLAAGRDVQHAANVVMIAQEIDTRGTLWRPSSRRHEATRATTSV
jgi:hypothetical protein